MRPLSFHHFISRFQNKTRITMHEINLFLKQFGTLLSAGIPITRCCDILEKIQIKTTLRVLIYAIKRDLYSGKTLSQSLQTYHEHFDSLVTQLIYLGEQTGKLDDILKHITAYQDKNLALQRQIKQTLFYPSLITAVALCLTFGMLLFVIPHFAELFDALPNQLPWITQQIFAFSTFLRLHLSLIIFTLTSLMMLVYFSRYSRKHTSLTNWIKHHTPVLRSLLHQLTLIHFVRNLAMTFSAGLPLTQGLTLSANACNNKPFALAVAHLANKIQAGAQLHQVMPPTHFPPLMIQMIKVGEESGMLTTILEKLCTLYEAEIALFLQRFNQLLEPLIMIVLGVLIGGIVIGMYLPLFNLGNAF